MVPTESKQCTACGETKPLDQFRRRGKWRVGTCTPCLNARHREWSAKNVDRTRAYSQKRKHTERTKAVRAAATKRCRARHPDRYRARAAKWYAKNAELSIRRAIDWRTKNPDEYKAIKDARRAREIGTQVGDRKAYIAYRKWVRTTPAIPCYWCRKPTKEGARHIDHIIPLVRGGADAVANLCVACPRCNQRKHAKLPEHFAGQSELNLA